MARRAEDSSGAHDGSAPRSANSSSVSGPRTRRRSATPSTSLIRRSSVSHWSSCSSSDRTSASSSSRSSAWPRSSASRWESRRGRRPAARRGASLLVQELGDVAEQERAREGRGLRGGHLDQPDPAGFDVAHEFREPGDVEDVLEAFADRFQDDGEGAELRCDLEQLCGALALLPQRGAFAGAAARQQQGAGRALAEPGREQRRAADLVGDDPADLALLERHVRRADGRLFAVVRESRQRCRVLDRTVRRVLRQILCGVEVQEVQAHQVGIRQPEHDAVVGMHHLRVHAVPLGEAGTQRQRPRRVHLRAERGMDHDPPVTQLVTEPLDEDGPVVRHMAAGAALFVDVRQGVVGGPGVEAGGEQSRAGVLLRQSADLAEERTQSAPQLQRAAQLVALPERQPAGNAGGGRDQDPVTGDVLDPPGRGAEREDVADPRLVHHLLVELTDPAAALLGVGAREEDPEEPPVGDRPPGGDGEPLCAGAAGDRAGHPVPHHAGAQLGEGVGGVAAGEHVQHGGERGLGQ